MPIKHNPNRDKLLKQLLPVCSYLWSFVPHHKMKFCDIYTEKCLQDAGCTTTFWNNSTATAASTTINANKQTNKWIERIFKVWYIFCVYCVCFAPVLLGEKFDIILHGNGSFDTMLFSGQIGNKLTHYIPYFFTVCVCVFFFVGSYR